MGIRLNLSLGVALAATAGCAQAGSITDLGLSLEQTRSLNAQLTAPITAPGIAFGSPTAFGAGWGQAYAGVGGQTLDNASQDVDGSAVLGGGLGDPARFIAFEGTMNIISLNEGFMKDGNWAFKAHRTLGDRSAVAVGIEDTGGWGEASDTNSSSYVAFTRVIDFDPGSPRRPLTFAYTAGLGNERFASPDGSLGVFGSVALSWHRQSTVIVDYDGRELNLALSAVPFYRIPLVVTAGLINVTERYEGLEFAAGVGYLHSF